MFHFVPGLTIMQNKLFPQGFTSDRIILLRLIIRKTVYTLVNVYAPQQGRPEAEKDRFYDQLNAVLAKMPLSEVLIPDGDWNGHVGRAADGFEEVHGGFGYGERNNEGVRLLDFAVAHDLVIGNTLFKKRNSHFITYASVTMRPRLTTSCFVEDCTNTFEMLRSYRGKSV